MAAAMSLTLAAQVSSNPSPIPVGYSGSITLTFDPLKGDGGMKNATECYSHIGLITSTSKDIHDWQYIKNNDWGTKNEPKWTATGDGKWKLTIFNIYGYFGCNMQTEITAIVMVMHNGTGDKNTLKTGRSSNGSDILVFIGKEVEEDIWENFTPAAVTTRTRPAGVDQGIYYGADGTSVTLCTFAAGKAAENSSTLVPAKHVFLLGDMTDWKLNNNYQLYRDGNYFWITLTGLEKGKEYLFQYAIERADGVKKQICDIYSEKVIHPDDGSEPRTQDPDLIGYPLTGADGGYVTVIQPGKEEYQWSEATLNFKRPDKNNLVIYETWIYDLTPQRNYKGAIQRLDYLQQLGVNAVELLPVSEFEGNISWGYSPCLYFAPDKTYGPANDLKAFIDECHKRGIAVILDMVYNHNSGLNPMNKLYPWGDDLKLNPWMNVNAPHKDGNQYGQDWNHDFEPAHKMFTRSLQYWLTEYKVDGYRLDLSHGLCGPTNNALANLDDYYTNGVKAVAEDAYMILEHWSDNTSYDWPYLVNKGMMVWSKMDYPFQEAAMGYAGQNKSNNFDDGFKKGYVTYAESHDEERVFFKTKFWGYENLKTDETARCQRIAGVLGFQCLMRGPQMFYHFQELGFDYSKFMDKDGKWGSDKDDDYTTHDNNGNVIKIGGKYNVTPQTDHEVKMEAKARPEEKGWMNESNIRMQQCRRVGKIIRLRTQIMPDVFIAGNHTRDVGNGKEIRSVRYGNYVYAVVNYSPDQTKQVDMPAGTWFDYLDGGDANTTYTLQPGEIKVFTGNDLAGLEDLEAETIGTNKALKVLQDGQIYIIRDGATYDITGRRM